jgi:hypothetical protein
MKKVMLSVMAAGILAGSASVTEAQTWGDVPWIMGFDSRVESDQVNRRSDQTARVDAYIDLDTLNLGDLDGIYASATAVGNTLTASTANEVEEIAAWELSRSQNRTRDTSSTNIEYENGLLNDSGKDRFEEGSTSYAFEAQDSLQRAYFGSHIDNTQRNNRSDQTAELTVDTYLWDSDLDGLTGIDVSATAVGNAATATISNVVGDFGSESSSDIK